MHKEDHTYTVQKRLLDAIFNELNLQKDGVVYTKLEMEVNKPPILEVKYYYDINYSGDNIETKRYKIKNIELEEI